MKSACTSAPPALRRWVAGLRGVRARLHGGGARRHRGRLGRGEAAGALGFSLVNRTRPTHLDSGGDRPSGCPSPSTRPPRRESSRRRDRIRSARLLCLLGSCSAFEGASTRRTVTCSSTSHRRAGVPVVTQGGVLAACKVDSPTKVVGRSRVRCWTSRPRLRLLPVYSLLILPSQTARFAALVRTRHAPGYEASRSGIPAALLPAAGTLAGSRSESLVHLCSGHGDRHTRARNGRGGLPLPPPILGIVAQSRRPAAVQRSPFAGRVVGELAAESGQPPPLTVRPRARRRAAYRSTVERDARVARLLRDVQRARNGDGGPPTRGASAPGRTAPNGPPTSHNVGVMHYALALEEAIRLMTSVPAK